MSTRTYEQSQPKVLQPDELEDKVCVVVGTRPGIIMFSPIIRELERRAVPFFVLHTGQHYSYDMDATFFAALHLAAPRYRLTDVQHCKLHGEQTAEMLKGCETALMVERPRLVLVGGDANTNLAGALAARKLGIQVGHIEAGERSYDWRMPEEHNRRMIDHISDYLFATNEESRSRLVGEDVQGKIVLSGNPIVDAAEQNTPLATAQFPVRLGRYGVLTLHREENVDTPAVLARIVEAVGAMQDIVFPAHPRTRRRIKQFGIDTGGLELVAPMGYLEFLSLLAGATVVLTDSGGVQQEAYILRRRCVTLRDSTEWRCTLPGGCNRLAGTTVEGIRRAITEGQASEPTWGQPFGDCHSAGRIVDIVTKVVRERENATV